MGKIESEAELLNRLIISDDDFGQAKKYIRFVLEKNLHENDDDKDVNLILKAFNTVLIVSYCRPFTKNLKNKKYPAIESLPKDYLSLLTSEEERLHKRILQIRNKEQAHSDPESHSVTLSNDKRISIKRDATIPLTQNEFLRLEKIIDKFLQKIINDKISHC